MSSEEDSSSATPMGLLEAASASVGGSPSASSLFNPHHPALTAHHHLTSTSASQGSAPLSGLKSSQLNTSSSGVKVKRTRQRVDAGEPRNSYASIANFSSTRAGYQMARGRMPGYYHPVFNRATNGSLNPFGDNQHLSNGMKEHHQHQLSQHHQPHHQNQPQNHQQSSHHQSLMSSHAPVNGCKKRKLYQPQQTTKNSIMNGNADEYQEVLEDDFSGEERDEDSLLDEKDDDELSPDDLRVEKSSGEKNSSSAPAKSQSESEKKEESLLDARDSNASVNNSSSDFQMVTGDDQERRSSNGSSDPSGEKQTDGSTDLQQQQNQQQPIPPVNGCKKRKLYQPQQTSKQLNGPTEDEEDSMDDDVLSEKNDTIGDEEVEDDVDDDEDDLTTDDLTTLSEGKQNSESGKQQEQKEQKEEEESPSKSSLFCMRQKYPPLFQQKHHPRHHSSEHHGAYSPNLSPDKRGDDESEKDGISLRRSGQFLDEARRMLRQDVMSSKESSPRSRRDLPDSKWLMALETELLENVAKAIEVTFADFGRRNPPTKRLREEDVMTPAGETASKDLTLLAQLLESKTPQSMASKSISSFLTNNNGRDERMRQELKSPVNGHGTPSTRGRSPFTLAAESASAPRSSMGHHNGSNQVMQPHPSLVHHFSSLKSANLSRNSNNSLLETRDRSDREILDDSPSSRSGTEPSGVRVICDPQSEALSLVMTPKRKRHKVTDTRITPRTVSRLLDPALINLFGRDLTSSPPQASFNPSNPSSAPPPPPLVPVTLPTSVAIPNPSLQNAELFAGPAFPFSDPVRFPLFGQNAGHANRRSESPDDRDEREIKETQNSIRESNKQHQAHMAQAVSNALAAHHLSLLAAANRASPDSLHGFPSSGGMYTKTLDSDPGAEGSEGSMNDSSLYDPNMPLTSTLTPMHLRKAKLMFFYVRYPSSAVLKMFFPDIKFNKNNTAQLVKWFSNFREFYYIQMEKYARQAMSEGITIAEDIHVTMDSELLRVLNLHYNRNNHIEVPDHFRYVVEQTLREFFKSIQTGKDSEQSWKKAIYKIIARMDDSVPEYFKSPTFLDQLE